MRCCCPGRRIWPACDSHCPRAALALPKTTASMWRFPQTRVPLFGVSYYLGVHEGYPYLGKCPCVFCLCVLTMLDRASGYVVTVMEAKYNLQSHVKMLAVWPLFRTDFQIWNARDLAVPFARRPTPPRPHSLSSMSGRLGLI